MYARERPSQPIRLPCERRLPSGDYTTAAAQKKSQTARAAPPPHSDSPELHSACAYCTLGHFLTPPSPEISEGWESQPSATTYQRHKQSPGSQNRRGSEEGETTHYPQVCTKALPPSSALLAALLAPGSQSQSSLRLLDGSRTVLKSAEARRRPSAQRCRQYVEALAERDQKKQTGEARAG